MELSHFAFLAFAAFSALRIVSYLPQIYRVAADSNGATAISYSTWGMWTGANVATALYAGVNLNDLYLAAVSVVYATCCVVVIVLTLVKRRRFLSAGRAEASADHPIRTLRLQLLEQAGPRLGLLAGSLAAITVGLCAGWLLTGATSTQTSAAALSNARLEALSASTNADDTPAVPASAEVAAQPAGGPVAAGPPQREPQCEPTRRKGTQRAKRATCGLARTPASR
jgi:hypothetical protein